MAGLAGRVVQDRVGDRAAPTEGRVGSEHAAGQCGDEGGDRHQDRHGDPDTPGHTRAADDTHDRPTKPHEPRGPRSHHPRPCEERIELTVCRVLVGRADVVAAQELPEVVVAVHAIGSIK